MNSLAFPNMFSPSKVKTISDKEATFSNLSLLLKSRKGSLFGDPYFGSNLTSIIFEQNGSVLVDIIKDEIYTTITEFMPQIKISRNDISLTSTNGINLSASLKIENKLNGEVSLYTIKLIDDEEQ